MNSLQALGFIPQRLKLGIYYSIGAMVAMLLANGAGLEHPQWSGMSVWAAAVPIRGAMFEKIVARLSGTLLGIVAGLALITLTDGAILPLCALTALWIGLCTWRGNANRTALGYFWLLAGYSAIMVAFLEIHTPELILHLGIDRFLTVAIGVIIAALVAGLFVPNGTRNPDIASEKSVLGKEISLQTLLKRLPRLAAMEATLELNGAGSNRRRTAAAHARGELLALSWQLRQAAGGRPTSPVPQFGAPMLNAAKNHKDNRIALQAALRAAGLLMALGLVWWATDIASGPYLLLGASVMISVFSAFESPHRMMAWVFTGQIIGAVFAILTRWVFWPNASTEVAQILMLAPLLLTAALAYGHSKSLKMALDIAMGSLLLLQIGLPLEGDFASYMGKVGATVGASAIALATFCLIFKTTPAKRKISARKLILAELGLYASGRRTLPSDASWHIRHEQRALRLAQGALTPQDAALLQFADEIYDFLQNRPLPERRFKLVAARIGRMHVAPSKAIEALEKWAGRADIAALARQAQII